MKHREQNHPGQIKPEPRSAKRESPEERTVAPPIEREHETYAGIFEEDERHEHERGIFEEEDERHEHERQ